MSVLSQCVFIPKPTLTEQNCPDQTGQVHIVTGGYGGVGLELSKILYQHNATLYIAGRSPEKANKAIDLLTKEYPNAKGSVEAIIVDFADLPSIKPAAEKFLAAQKVLNGLTLNHGVMFTPKGSKSPQGYDLQTATNCLGSYLFYQLLRPALVNDGSRAARVTWASSLTMDANSPKPGGIVFEKDGVSPRQDLDIHTQYAQTKAANSHMAHVLAPRDAADNIIHLSFNPGNLDTDLSQHMPKIAVFFMRHLLLYPARYGAYTELYALLADVPREKSGSYIAPWGRLVPPNRKDLLAAFADTSKESVGERFTAWVEKQVAPFA